MPLPAQIGKYEILDLIGRGGMGVVYKARDTVLGRLVALKVMTSDLAGESEVQVRFLREARSVAALQHSNIVVVHELGEYEGSPFIAMEYLEGEPLDRLIRNHAPLTVLEKVDIILQVAKALQYAHDKGVIHRDVKPGNIMRMGEGSVKVVDFGIAHLADQTITKTGMVLGTLAYLAPEQLNGEGIDRRTDIFSLGVVLYQLLSGKLPFEGGSTAEVMMKILIEAPPPLPLTGEVNPPELQPIVDKALAKKKDERYQTCTEVAQELIRLRTKYEVQTHLAPLEQERKALLVQLDRQGAAVKVPAGQQHAAASVARAPATPLPQASPLAGDSIMSPTRLDQYAQPGQPISRHSKQLTWMTGGLSIVLAALIVTGIYLWRSYSGSRTAPTLQSSPMGPNATSSPRVVDPSLSSSQSPSKKIADIRPQGYATDLANVIDPATKAKLEALCAEVEQQTGAQIALVTVNSLDGRTREEYAADLYKQLGVGSKKENNGVLLLLDPKERQWRIEIGYGLEPVISDVRAADIGQEMVPNLKRGDYSAAVLLGITRIA